MKKGPVSSVYEMCLVWEEFSRDGSYVYDINFIFNNHDFNSMSC